MSEIISQNSPIPAMKAVKSEAEIAGYRRAMVRDGVAMVKFPKWLLPAVEAGGETEISIDKKLTALRAEQDLFRDISFDTIAGYRGAWSYRALRGISGDRYSAQAGRTPSAGFRSPVSGCNYRPHPYHRSWSSNR